MRILRKQFFERLQKNESLVVRGLLCTQRGRATRFKLHFGYASLNDDSVNSKVKKEKEKNCDFSGHEPGTVSQLCAIVCNGDWGKS